MAFQTESGDKYTIVLDENGEITIEFTLEEALTEIGDLIDDGQDPGEITLIRGEIVNFFVEEAKSTKVTLD